MPSELYPRRNIRLKEYDYSWPGAYFVTTCTHLQECLFGRVIQGEMILNDFGKVVETEWLTTADVRRNIELDEFVVMPNHFHGILIIHNTGFSGSSVGATRRVAPTNMIKKMNNEICLAADY